MLPDASSCSKKENAELEMRNPQEPDDLPEMSGANCEKRLRFGGKEIFMEINKLSRFPTPRRFIKRIDTNKKASAL